MSTSHSPLVRFWAGLLLIISILGWLFLQPALIAEIRAGQMDPKWLFLAPSIFLILLIIITSAQFLSEYSHSSTIQKFMPLGFGLMVITLLLPPSFREYRVRTAPEIITLDFIENFFQHKDARLRALATLALHPSLFDNLKASSLIHNALLDKDPLVRDAAKLVIEEHLGIKLKSGREGVEQAKSLVESSHLSAAIQRKGSP